MTAVQAAFPDYDSLLESQKQDVRACFLYTAGSADEPEHVSASRRETYIRDNYRLLAVKNPASLEEILTRHERR